MDALLRLSGGIDGLLARVAKVAGWAGVALIAVTIFDVITRRFLVLGSTKLQELEWHFHVVLFALLLGYAYIKDAHVRIDLVRERLPSRVQWWLELLGAVCFLMAYAALVVYFSYDFAARSFVDDEISASATGLSHRWIIKSVIPIGFALLWLAGLSVVIRKLAQLFGSADQRRRATEMEGRLLGNGAATGAGQGGEA